MDRAILDERIRRYSVTHGVAREPKVLVVASRGDVGALFARARQEVGPDPVRIVGHGVTLPAVRPPWVERANVTLTEIGAFRVRSMLDASEELRGEVRRWVRACFEGTLEGAVEPIFFPAASLRLFQEHFELAAIAEGISATEHRRIVFAAKEDPLLDLVTPRPAARFRMGDASRLVALGGAGVVASALHQLRSALGARASAAELRRRRSRRPKGTVWVALIPDLDRVNRHVINEVAKPLLEREALGGVLLLGSLASGLRSERDLRTRTATALWAGLGDELRQPEVPIDQIVGDTSVAMSLAHLPADVLASVGVLRRMLQAKDAVTTANTSAGLAGRTQELARLATVDVFRARAAARAAKRLLKHRELSGSSVVFVGCSMSAAAAAVDVLRRGGVASVDFVHGAGWDNAIGAAETPADVVVTWTEPDAEVYRKIGCIAVEGGMPLPQLDPPRARSSIRRVLLLSNYCHRDMRSRGFPLRAYQTEILRLAVLARARGETFRFVWRPHPSDDVDIVRDALAQVGDAVELRMEGTLRDAIRESDVVVSSLSTAVYEAFFSQRPVLVHFAPELDEASVYAFIPASRRFFRAERALEILERLPTSDDVERAARQSLFRGEERPHTVADALAGVVGVRAGSRSE